MSLKDSYKTLKTLLESIQGDLDKAEAGNKAASQRVRTSTIRFEKVAKVYRKESIQADKSGGSKKSGGKKGKASKPAVKHAAKSAGKAKAKAKGSASHKSAKSAKKSSKGSAKKRATAKLPKKSK